MKLADDETRHWALGSVSRPGPELFGVAYRPDVLDPVVGDVEREHRYGDAVLLRDQAGLSVDRPLQDFHVRCPAGEIDQVTRDLLAALDGAERGAGHAAAVGSHRGAGVEEADEGTDVLGLPCLLEVPDDGGLPGRGGRGGLRGADTAAGRGGQLPAGRRGTAGDLGHLGEG